MLGGTKQWGKKIFFFVYPRMFPIISMSTSGVLIHSIESGPIPFCTFFPLTKVDFLGFAYSTSAHKYVFIIFCFAYLGFVSVVSFGTTLDVV